MAKNLIEMERKVLLGFTGLTVFGILLIFVSFSTDYWMIVTIPSGLYRNASRAYVVGHHSGLWRICREELDNWSLPVVHSKCYLIHGICFSERSLFSLHIRSMWETICDAWACWSGWKFGPNSTEYPYSEIQNTPPPPKMKIVRNLGTLTFQFQNTPPPQIEI